MHSLQRNDLLARMPMGRAFMPIGAKESMLTALALLGVHLCLLLVLFCDPKCADILLP